MYNFALVSFGDYLDKITSPYAVVIAAIFLAVALPCWGSAKGVGMVGRAGAGLLSEQPEMFGKTLALQALPMTQGIYGFITGFMVMLYTGIIGGGFMSSEAMTYSEAGYFFFACMPIAIVGYISAIHQAKVCVSGIQMLAKQKDKLGQAITSAALVETYAIFSLLVSLLLIIFHGNL